MKKLYKTLITLVSSAAMFTAVFTLSTTCRLWLYQPSVPEKLRRMDTL